MSKILTVAVIVVTTWLAEMVIPSRARIPAKELPIEVQVMPSVCLAPCTVRLTVTIPPSLINRWAVVEIDGAEFHSEWIQLEGDRAPKTHHLKLFTIYEPDNYIVRAVLYDTSREYARQQKLLIVKGEE